MTEIIAQRIFVLDNDLFSLTINKQVLKNLGCTNVMRFDNEIDFFRKLHEQPRVVLLDYRTNPQKGLEVLKAVKELQPETYVVFIVGPSGIMEALFSLNDGAFEYIIKDKKYAATVAMVMNKLQLMEDIIYKNLGKN
jgi:DNA-binding NtrC family response regulator